MAKVTNSTFIASPACAKTTCHELLHTIVEEQRNFTMDEERKFKNYYEFCDSETKAKIQEIISDMNSYGYTIEVREQKEKQIRKEEKRMNNNEFLKNLEKEQEIDVTTLETRQVGTQYAPVAEGTTMVEVPQNIVAGILMEAQRTNEIFGRCTFIATSQDTKLNVGSYQQQELAKLNEFEEINMQDFNTDHVEVVLERYGTGTRVSKRLIASSNFDIMQHVRLLMGDRLGLTAEKLAIAALAKGVTDGKVAKVEFTDEKPLEALVKGLLKLKPVDRTQSVVVCSPDFFEKAILEEDSVGRNKLSYELQQIRPTVMGVPVVVSDALEDGAYIGNFRRALVACVNLQELTAKDEPKVHSVDVFMNVYLGVSVQMPEAVVRLAPQA